MAEVTIRFRHSPSTGRREIVIAYESDDDMLPHEHERDHRALVEELLGVPVTDEMGDIVVERISKGEDAPEEQPDTAPAAREAEREKG